MPDSQTPDPMPDAASSETPPPGPWWSRPAAPAADTAAEAPTGPLWGAPTANPTAPYGQTTAFGSAPYGSAPYGGTGQTEAPYAGESPAGASDPALGLPG